jgi:hypothetical protein
MRTYLISILRKENALGLLAGAAIVVASALAIHHPYPGKEGVVTFDPISFDFGKLPQAEVKRHNFKLVNHGDAEVRVLALRSTCKCTVVETMTGQRIAAKGFLVIPVEFHTGSDQGSGAAKVEALLERQGERYYARALISAFVEGDFEIQPRSLDFGLVKAGEKAIRIINILPGRLEEFKLKLPDSPSELDTCLLTNLSGSTPKQFNLQVTFNAPLVKATKVFVQRITIMTSSKRVPVLSIPVSATIRPDYELAPNILVLLKASTSGESRFTIDTLRPCRISHITVEGHSVSREVTLATAGDPSIWDLSHCYSIPNALLHGAERINFELEVRTGAECSEAHSVSAQIKSL